MMLNGKMRLLVFLWGALWLASSVVMAIPAACPDEVEAEEGMPKLENAVTEEKTLTDEVVAQPKQEENRDLEKQEEITPSPECSSDGGGEDVSDDCIMHMGPLVHGDDGKLMVINMSDITAVANDTAVVAASEPVSHENPSGVVVATESPVTPVETVLPSVVVSGEEVNEAQETTQSPIPPLVEATVD